MRGRSCCGGGGGLCAPAVREPCECGAGWGRCMVVTARCVYGSEGKRTRL